MTVTWAVLWLHWLLLWLIPLFLNQPLAQAFTDAQGYVQIAVSAADATRLVVPYFGEVWDLSRAGRGELRFTLLLEPGNQPGLIP